jgi:hypothetical protein
MTEDNKKPTIAICIPHAGSVSMTFATDTLARLTSKSDSFDKLILTQRGYNVAASRNKMAKCAINEYKVDYVMFLDSDQVFRDIEPNKAIELLLDAREPFVSGITRVKISENWYLSAWYRMPGSKWSSLANLSTGIIEADAVGAFCCLVKREVFENIQEPYFHTDSEIGEDFYFCDKVQQAGYRILVRQDVRLDHLGELTLGIDGTIRQADLANIIKIG